MMHFVDTLNETPINLILLLSYFRANDFVFEISEISLGPWKACRS